MKEQRQIDELSKAIDALNQRKTYNTLDSEVSQLLQTASFIKQYGCTSAETAIISQLADKIHSDVTARHRRKRLVSILAGAAAAALLFAGVSFHTPTEFAQENGGNLTKIPQVAVAERPNAIVTDGSNTINSLPANTGQSSAKTSQSVKKADKLPPRDNTVSNPESQKSLGAQERPPVVAKTKTSDAAIVMVIPGRSADSVLADVAGTVRQVYGKNTDKEITVTQHSKMAANKTAAAPSLSVAPAIANQAKSAVTVNKATRMVNDVEVVVEGKQSQAELEKLADTLVPASQTGKQQSTPPEKPQKE